MSAREILLPAALVWMLSLAACGGQESPAAVSAADASPERPAAAEHHQAKAVQACKLITSAEIAALVGKPLEPMPDDGGGRTGCVWQAADSALPHVELKIEWGAAEAAMTAFGMLEKREPGISGPYDDLGDEAVVMGPAVMIKRDDDLITIMAMGVDDADAAVRKIYETATARM